MEDDKQLVSRIDKLESLFQSTVKELDEAKSREVALKTALVEAERIKSLNPSKEEIAKVAQEILERSTRKPDGKFVYQVLIKFDGTSAGRDENGKEQPFKFAKPFNFQTRVEPQCKKGQRVSHSVAREVITRYEHETDTTLGVNNVEITYLGERKQVAA